MVAQIYPNELQLKIANSTNTAFLYLHLLSSNVLFFVCLLLFFMTKAFILIFILLFSRFCMATFLVTLRMVLIFLIRFARVSSHLSDFNACKKTLTAKLIAIGSIKLGKRFLSFIVDTTN